MIGEIRFFLLISVFYNLQCHRNPPSIINKIGSNGKKYLVMVVFIQYRGFFVPLPSKLLLCCSHCALRLVFILPSCRSVEECIHWFFYIFYRTSSFPGQCVVSVLLFRVLITGGWFGWLYFFIPLIPDHRMPSQEEQSHLSQRLTGVWRSNPVGENSWAINELIACLCSPF